MFDDIHNLGLLSGIRGKILLVNAAMVLCGLLFTAHCRDFGHDLAFIGGSYGDACAMICLDNAQRWPCQGGVKGLACKTKSGLLNHGIVSFNPC